MTTCRFTVHILARGIVPHRSVVQCTDETSRFISLRSRCSGTPPCPDAAVGCRAQHVSDRREPVCRARRTSLVARLTEHQSRPTLLNDSGCISYVNSTITLADQNGPGGAQFQRNTTLDRPLVNDPSAPGQCNPALSIDPISGIPQCSMGYLFNNGFGGKMPGVEFLGTNAAYGGRGFSADPSYMPWGHTNPTYEMRDDILKSIGKHTLQFGAQFVLRAAKPDQQRDRRRLRRRTGIVGLQQSRAQHGKRVRRLPDAGSFQRRHDRITSRASRRIRRSAAITRRIALANHIFRMTGESLQPKLTLNLGTAGKPLRHLSREVHHNAWNWEAEQVQSDKIRGRS
jgi:hypothetical protein